MEVKNYKLVFCDDFDGKELDLSKWYYRSNGKRRDGFNSPNSVKVENGNLVIEQRYYDGEYGEGWYTGMIGSKERFVEGYFECRCICSESIHGGSWSAFWLQSENSYIAEKSKGGIGGAEIDIFEGFCGSHNNGGVDFNIHVAGKIGSTKKLDSLGVARVDIEDCYNAYHVYGLSWTQKSYTLYIDGRKIKSSSWGDGVSQSPEEIILSLELPDKEPLSKNLTTKFIVDYVKVYQKR